MSRFGSTDYSPRGTTGSSNDYKDRDKLSLGRYAIIEFTLDRVGVYQNDGRQNIILNMDDVEVLEGVLTEATHNDTLKVVGWDRWYDRDPETGDLIPFEDGGEITLDDLPRRMTIEAGGETYKYDINQGVLEGVDDPADADAREMWMSNGRKTRTLAKVLSADGHGIVDEENKRESHGWLNASDEESFNLRDELQGRRLMMWHYNEEIEPTDDNDLDQAITFTDTVLLDAETEAGIVINNGNGGPTESEDNESDGSDTDEEAEQTTTSAGDGDFPDGIDDLIDMFARNGRDSREEVSGMIEAEAPDDYTVDMDAVVEAIRERMD